MDFFRHISHSNFFQQGKKSKNERMSENLIRLGELDKEGKLMITMSNQISTVFHGYQVSVIGNHMTAERLFSYDFSGEVDT